MKSDICNGFMPQTHHVQRMVNRLPKKIALKPNGDFRADSVSQFPTPHCTPSSYTCCAVPRPAQQGPFSVFLLSSCQDLSLKAPSNTSPVPPEAGMSPGTWWRQFRNCGLAGRV